MNLKDVFEQAHKQAVKDTFVPRGMGSIRGKLLGSGNAGGVAKSAPKKKAAKKAAKKK